MHETFQLVAVASIFPLMALVLTVPFYVVAWLRGSNEGDSPASTRPRAGRRAARKPRTIDALPGALHHA